MKKLFNIELTTKSLNITLGHRSFRFARPSARKAMAKRLAEEGPLAVCLSILYKHQGWLADMHNRSVGVTGFGDIAAPGVAPRRHGGRGRGTLAPFLDERDRLFASEALGMFEFRGMAAATTVEAADSPAKSQDDWRVW